MAREVNPNRIKAKEIWLEHDGSITNRQISEMVGEDEKKIAVWKQRDKWVIQQNENVVQQNNSNVVQQKQGAPKGNHNAAGHGAPKGNKNALGNRGGHPAPGNKNAEKHGFFAKILPDDPETREIIESIDLKSPLEILWENIVLQYGIIARAQRLMFVKNQEDLTKVLKRQKESSGLNSDSWEKEYELQFAWDKHAAFLKAQSVAMKTLDSLLARYDEMTKSELATAELQARVDKLRAEITKIKAGPGEDGNAGKVNVVFNIPRPPKEGAENA